MDELWRVEFSLMMQDIEESTPSIDGEMIVRGTDIFDVLRKASDRLNTFGYDNVIIHGATRNGFAWEKDCQARKETKYERSKD